MASERHRGVLPAYDQGYHQMSGRHILLACLLLVVFAVACGCQNDQVIIDKHEQALLDEAE